MSPWSCTCNFRLGVGITVKFRQGVSDKMKLRLSFKVDHKKSLQGIIFKNVVGKGVGINMVRLSKAFCKSVNIMPKITFP